MIPLSVVSPKAKAQAFSTQLSDNVHVLSDRAYRRSAENLFEAVGNVIITQDSTSIYGEKATLNFETGESEVLGNVRYINPDLTMYGSELHYNFQTKFLRVRNARIITDQYLVLGEEIWREKPGEIRAINAEYSTCRDCPESWSVFGSEVHITVGEYIRARHAYIKIRGVVTMYLPYLVLPIKKDRESGLLFPDITLRSRDGVRFSLPYFWAISDHRDMTLTPAYFGERGFGGELEYRQVLGERRWFEFNTLMSNDRLYSHENFYSLSRGTGSIPADRDNSTFRHFSQYEQHYQFSPNLTHHLWFQGLRDKDMIRDFDFSIGDELIATEVGGSGFLDWRMQRFSFAVESHFRDNVLTNDPLNFDDDFVQILPRAHLQMSPINLWQGDAPLIRRLSLDAKADFTVFRQNKVEENRFLRNAQRTQFFPQIDLDLAQLGPVNIRTQARIDGHYYHFPTLEEDRSFRKWSHVQETELSFELERIFGVAYLEDLDRSEVAWEGEDPFLRSQNLPNEKLIRPLPQYRPDFQQDTINVEKSSYRHSQRFSLFHYYLYREETSGNEDFLAQIDRQAGQFDAHDALVRTVHLRTASQRTAIPLSNSLELQWNNTLTRKNARTIDPFQDRRYLRDNFTYARLAHFNVSQGLNLDGEKEDASTREKLTRLFIDTGLTLGRTSIRVREYYFYDTQDHLTNLSVSQRFDRGRLSVGLVYDSFAVPSDKMATLGGSLSLTEVLDISARYRYDLEEKKEVDSLYLVTYAPLNNCWRLEFNYSRNQIEKKGGINLLINFGDENFHSLGR